MVQNIGKSHVFPPTKTYSLKIVRLGGFSVVVIEEMLKLVPDLVFSTDLVLALMLRILIQKFAQRLLNEVQRPELEREAAERQERIDSASQ